MVVVLVLLATVRADGLRNVACLTLTAKGPVPPSHGNFQCTKPAVEALLLQVATLLVVDRVVPSKFEATPVVVLGGLGPNRGHCILGNLGDDVCRVAARCVDPLGSVPINPR